MTTSEYFKVFNSNIKVLDIKGLMKWKSVHCQPNGSHSIVQADTENHRGFYCKTCKEWAGTINVDVGYAPESAPVKQKTISLKPDDASLKSIIKKAEDLPMNSTKRKIYWE